VKSCRNSSRIRRRAPSAQRSLIGLSGAAALRQMPCPRYDDVVRRMLGDRAQADDRLGFNLRIRRNRFSRWTDPAHRSLRDLHNKARPAALASALPANRCFWSNGPGGRMSFPPSLLSVAARSEDRPISIHHPPGLRDHTACLPASVHHDLDPSDFSRCRRPNSAGAAANMTTSPMIDGQPLLSSANRIGSRGAGSGPSSPNLPSFSRL